MQDREPLYKRDPEAFREAYEQIREEIFSSCDLRKASKRKIAHFTSGLPGTGKSTLLFERYLKNKKETLVVIDPDDIRAMTPGYEDAVNLYGSDVAVSMFHADAGLIASKIRNECIEKGYSYVVDGTLTNPKAAEIEISRAKAGGYETRLYLLVAGRLESYIGTSDRYRRTLISEEYAARRYVFKEVIDKKADEFAQGAKKAIETGVDRLVVCDRGEKLIDTKKPGKYLATVVSMIENADDYFMENIYSDHHQRTLFEMSIEDLIYTLEFLATDIPKRERDAIAKDVLEKFKSIVKAREKVLNSKKRTCKGAQKCGI